jgi:hypothetical protein
VRQGLPHPAQCVMCAKGSRRRRTTIICRERAEDVAQNVVVCVAGFLWQGSTGGFSSTMPGGQGTSTQAQESRAARRGREGHEEEGTSVRKVGRGREDREKGSGRAAIQEGRHLNKASSAKIYMLYSRDRDGRNVVGPPRLQQQATNKIRTPRSATILRGSLCLRAAPPAGFSDRESRRSVTRPPVYSSTVRKREVRVSTSPRPPASYQALRGPIPLVSEFQVAGGATRRSRGGRRIRRIRRTIAIS